MSVMRLRFRKLEVDGWDLTNRLWATVLIRRADNIGDGVMKVALTSILEIASEHRRIKRIDKICLQNLQTFITPSPTLSLKRS